MPRTSLPVPVGRVRCGRHRLGPALLAAAVLLVLAAPASAESLLDRTVSTTGTLERSCFASELPSQAGLDTAPVTLPAASIVQATLEGDSRDDWDLAIVERDTGRVIAGAAERDSSEVAESVVAIQTDAILRACRRSGDGDAEVSVGSIPLDTSASVTPKLVHVDTPTRESKERLQTLGLDLTEHGGDDFVAVVAYGQEDLIKLTANGFSYDVEVPDLVQQAIEDRQADQAFAASVRTSSLPSGRTTYRRLFDYSNEMKQLAENNSDLVKPITLSFETWEGRSVEGLEITTNPGARDGKPVYLQMALHHAREWPSGEHVMEYVRELIQGYRAGDQRIANLLESTRTIAVPVVNPDGFNISREFGELAQAGAGRDSGSYLEAITQIIGIPYEFWRKNCRLLGDPEAGTCLQQPASGLAHPGVDPNRNYGGFWGGPGSSGDSLSQSYRGPGPFSEPETRNIQELVSDNQVTTLITNHTYSNLWLRPPGQAESPETPDEQLYRQLGEDITAHNGYSNIKAFQLYDTTGSTEDWSYWSTGGLGYTPEIGCLRKEGNECRHGNFHGPYEEHVVQEYEGGTPAAPQGGGNREGFLIAHENTLLDERHSVIAGKAPPNAVLRVQKTFQTETWEGGQSFEDHLETAMDVPASGRFEFHVNPSTRPVVAQTLGREPTGEPSEPQSFSGSPAGPPADGAVPCADYDTEDPLCFNDHPFSVPENGNGVDNAKVAVRIEWPTPASDWDLKVFRDTDGDGSSVGETEKVTESGQGATTFEEASFAEPRLTPGDYVARVINWAAGEPYEGSVTFEGPQFQEAQEEAWTLTCERDGEVITSQQVFVDRGERASLNLRSCSRSKGGGRGPGG